MEEIELFTDYLSQDILSRYGDSFINMLKKKQDNNFIYIYKLHTAPLKTQASLFSFYFSTYDLTGHGSQIIFSKFQFTKYLLPINTSKLEYY